MDAEGSREEKNVLPFEGVRHIVPLLLFIGIVEEHAHVGSALEIS